ncbi:hypothetical protein BC827DRAFT_1381492 [Russula dissimulans]|nr:hypothetical protein BC827DRAFT_1381492 [Russula dissimulans]
MITKMAGRQSRPHPFRRTHLRSKNENVDANAGFLGCTYKYKYATGFRPLRSRAHFPSNVGSMKSTKGLVYLTRAGVGPASSASTNPSSFTSATETHPSASGAKHRNTPSAAESTSQTSTKEKREYTAKNLAVVKRVRAFKVTEYYEILAVKRDCDEAEVKAYRKLALALHPNKDGAPSTDEAFKMVSKAFQVLSDPQKRAIYDRSGGDPESRFGGMSSSGPSSGFATSPFGGATFKFRVSPPEDLFNMFFGGGTAFSSGPVFTASFGPGGFRTTRVHTSRGRPQEQQQEPATLRSLFVQLLPLLFLFAFSLLSALPSLFSTIPVPDPRFSFESSSRFNLKQTTQPLGVQYHVDSAEFSRHPIAAEIAQPGQSDKPLPMPVLQRFEFVHHVGGLTEFNQSQALCGVGIKCFVLHHEQIRNIPVAQSETFW